MARFARILSLCTLLLFGLRAEAAVPRLDRLVEVAPNRIVLIGDFGHPCKGCFIAVAHRDGPRLRYVTRNWTPNRIELRLHDVGGSLEVAVAVVRPEGRSRALPYRLQPRIVPPPGPAGRRAPWLGSDWVLMGSYAGTTPDEGVDRYPVAIAPPPCGATAQAFDHAELEVDRSRGGDAILLSQPPSGCLGRCPPIEVGWFHEAGGAVKYVLRLFRREIVGICDPMPGD